MMDLKEIIKWFIPCFHILLGKLSVKMDARLTVFVFVFFLFNFSKATAIGGAASDSFLGINVSSYNSSFSDISKNQSEFRNVTESERSLEDATTGRTFGRPFKKMIAGLLPIIFQMGAATTWAAVATLIGIKTLFVTLAILKLLLIAGAAKVGALFASKQHYQHKEWSPQKEVHLHIHNGGGHVEHVPSHDEHYGWSREGVAVTADGKPIQGPVFESPNGPQDIYLGPQQIYPGPHDPNAGPQPYTGPQTIRTPYGNYVKVGSKKKREIRKLRRK